MRRFAAILCLGWLLPFSPLLSPAAEPTTPQEFDAAFTQLAASRGSAPDSARLRDLFALAWRYQMVEDPEWATYVGYPGLNDRWNDLSAGALARRRQELKRISKVLETLQRDALSPNEQLYFDLFVRAHQLALESESYPEELLAITQLSGPQQTLAQTLAQMPAATPAGYQAMLRRLQTSGTRIDHVKALLQTGLSRGVTPPQITLRDVPQQVLNNVTEDARNSPLFRPFTTLPSNWTEADRAALQSAALAAITNVAYPRFRELHRFLVEEYLPRARTNTAASSLPNGAAWYQHRVREYTTTTLSPQEIHELGLREVKRIRAAMEDVISRTGFQGSFAEFLEFLRTDPQFYYGRGTELLAGYRDISKQIDLGLPKLFGHLPRLPYGVLAVPSYMERAQTTAYYQPGAPARGRPGVFFANTYALNMRPRWEMEALTLHEAVPGHHLQIALAQELENVPEFQKQAEITAFVEGWALYAESLGPDLGMYADPYSKFGQLTYEMWRAIRLVVDTGMHSLGWSRQQAIDYFLQNSGKTQHDVEVEVDRYLVWPGQALAYKIGELKIKELRALAERELGADFDLRAFHDALLGKGALPLDLLEPRMKAWIASQKQR